MRIGIDARLYGLEHAGIGRYVMNLVDRMVTDKQHQWVLFLAPHHMSKFSGQSHITCIEADIRHYSLKEQTIFLKLLYQAKLDLLHVPHFNVPILYNRPFVVTIHDILWHQVRGGSVTTLSPLKYYMKYAGYQLTVAHAVHAARAIFAPSNYVKSDLTNTFPMLNPNKITVTYEGIDVTNDTSRNEYQPDHPSITYVGSAYPHKNLTVLFQAVQWLKESAGTAIPVTIVGSRSIFLDNMKTEVKKLGIQSQITFAGYQSDAAIKELLRRSLCLVHPSKSEGFGLTGLEAMAVGTPVIAARSTSLPEIYQDAAIFFEPDDYQALAGFIQMLIKKPTLRIQMIAKGKQHVKQFSWDEMVETTKNVYQNL